jgi:DNA polymerase type B, organellar and viral
MIINNPEEMLNESMKYLMENKYNNYNVYLHNLSYFDGIYLIERLSSLTNEKLKPIIREGRIITFPFKYKSLRKNKTINFRDSYLLLPSSLYKLCKIFHVEDIGIFPFNFVNNKNIDLNYEGKFPKIKSFNIEKIVEDKEYSLLRRYMKIIKNL